MREQINFIIKKFMNNKPLQRVEMELEINFLKKFVYSKEKIKTIISKNFNFMDFKHIFIKSLIYKFGGKKINCTCMFYQFNHLKFNLEAKNKIMKIYGNNRFHTIGHAKRQILKEKRKKLTKYRGIVKLRK